MANRRDLRLLFVAALLLAIIGVAPAAGAVGPGSCTATITPDPLYEGQTDQVDLGGLAPGEQVDYLFHQGPSTGTLLGTVDGTGSYRWDVSFRQGTYDFTFTGHTSGVTCDLHVEVLADPDPLVLTVTLDSTGLSLDQNGLAVSGTFACNHDATAFAGIFLSQDLAGPASGSANLEGQPCGSIPTAWHATIAASPSSWVNGPATLAIHAFALTGTRSASADLSTEVTISGVAPAPTGAVYYLALGDSLATGYAAGPGEGYVDLLAHHYADRWPGLTLVDYGCSSETTTSMMDGSICRFGGKSQLDAATDFLAAHPGQVAMITIDIGGNDVVFCSDATCFNDALSTMDANLATILGRLRAAAGPATPMFGMNYFDPLLNHWFAGADGEAYARGTVTLTDSINSHLVADYSAAGAPVADVAGPDGYAVDDFTVVASPWGDIPLNVRNACSWLDIGCVVGSVGSFGDDANAAGYQVIAHSYEAVIDAALAAPPEPAAPVAPSAAPVPPAAVVTATPAFTG